MTTNLTNRGHFKRKNKVLPTFLDGAMNDSNMKLVIKPDRNRNVSVVTLGTPIAIPNKSIQLQGLTNLDNSLLLGLGGTLLLDDLLRHVLLSL